MEKNPDDPIIRNNYGVALDAVGMHEEAIAQYDYAIQVNPEYPTAWYNKANSLTFIGEFTEALECYDEVLELEPELFSAYYDKAIALIALGRKKKAEEICEEIFRDYPDNLQAQLGRARILVALGESEEALRRFLEFQNEAFGALAYERFGDRCHAEIGDLELGAEFKRTPSELRRILGWRHGGLPVKLASLRLLLTPRRWL